MQIQAHRFRPRDLVGGDVALDLVNTVTARNALPIDWLDGYARLLEWARLSGSFDEGALHDLEGMSSADRRGAEEAVGRLRVLRESLVEVLTAVILRQDPPLDHLGRLEREWKDAVAHARFAGEAGRVRLELSVARSRLEYVRHELALRAVHLLETLPLERTRICPGPHCGWLFVDRSRGGGRRWCDMATCGNAAKGRRHYDRLRERHARTNRRPADGYE
jgi:predicted RNA-binding Zn ribbon-like protein